MYNITICIYRLTVACLTSHCSLKDQKITGDISQLHVKCDNHRLLTIEMFICQLPYDEPLTDRNQFPQLTLDKNSVMYVNIIYSVMYVNIIYSVMYVNIIYSVMYVNIIYTVIYVNIYI